MDFIKIDVLNIEKQHYPEQDMFTPPTIPIINSYFNKHPISWELIHRCLLQTYASVMKSMRHHKSLTRLPKTMLLEVKPHNMQNMLYINMTTLTRVTTVDTTNLQLGELICMYHFSTM